MLGVIAKAEIEKLTETGKDLVRLRASQVSRSARRRTVASVAQIKLRDPVLLEQIHQDNRKTLIRFLRKHLKQSFTAAELGTQAGVAKKWVRRLLETSLKVSIVGRGDRYVFQSRPPKRKRIF
jgi:response regulator of citrate/malate metabolism